MKKFIEIITKDNTVVIINTVNVSHIIVKTNAICTIVFTNGIEIETNMYKEDLLKELR